MRRLLRLRFVPGQLVSLNPVVALKIHTEVSLSPKPPLKAVTTTSSCCFSMICGVVENILKAVSRCAGSCDWLAWKRAPSSSGHATPTVVSACISRPAKSPITFVRVLSRQLCDSISDLASDRVVGLFGEAREQLRADRLPLGMVQGQEEVGGLARGGLAWFRGLAPEDDGGKCSRLLKV